MQNPCQTISDEMKDIMLNFCPRTVKVFLFLFLHRLFCGVRKEGDKWQSKEAKPKAVTNDSYSRYSFNQGAGLGTLVLQEAALNFFRNLHGCIVGATKSQDDRNHFENKSFAVAAETG
jgi:hypothetical protein